jgi:hypothetical protein
MSGRGLRIGQIDHACSATARFAAESVFNDRLEPTRTTDPYYGFMGYQQFIEFMNFRAEL